MERKLITSSSPHLRSSETINSIMLNVIIALLPATAAGIYFFGFPAFKLIALAILSAVGTEYAVQKLMGRKVTITDYSAALTGLLIAFNIPSSAPWWIPVIGSIFGIAIVKQAFGGIGENFMNPALGARAMLLASWPVIMTSWVTTGPDAVSTATPLALLKSGNVENMPSMFDLLIGNVGGCIGETSALLLILGGLYLMYKKIIDWRIPFTYIGTVAVLTLVFGGGFENMMFHMLSGGLMLGAFFMATDYSSTPVTPKGHIIFGIGCGVITTVIRLYGGYPEGVSYSILLMNLAAPLIDKYTSPKQFGEVKKSA